MIDQLIDRSMYLSIYLLINLPIYLLTVHGACTCSQQLSVFA